MPYNEYIESIGSEVVPEEQVIIPHEVVKLSTIGGLSLIRAWREHLGLSQQEVADKMGISQVAYSKMEAQGKKNRISTYKRIADAMGIQWEQLSE